MPPKDTPQVLADPALASRVAASLWDGSDSRAAMSLAQQVARSTYCRSGPITPDNGVRRISNPQDISAVLEESQKQGRDVIPAGIKGTSVPAAQFRSDGTKRWIVWLKCDAPFPYLARDVLRRVGGGLSASCQISPVRRARRWQSRSSGQPSGTRAAFLFPERMRACRKYSYGVPTRASG